MHAESRSRPVTSLLHWVDSNWQYAGIVAGCFYLLILPLTGIHWTLPRLLLWLQLPMYIAHQLEEHLHDRFRHWVNEHMGGGREVLTPRAVTIINIGGVWCLDFLAVYLAQFVGAGCALLAFYLAIVNAIIHIVGGIASRSYNPGLITAIVLLLPFGCWGAIANSSAYQISWRAHVVCLLVIVALHVVIVAQVARRRRELSFSV